MSHTGIAVVWPAWFPGSTDPESHVTALFLGNTETVTFDRGRVEDVVSRFNLGPGHTKAHKRIERFGVMEDVPVIRLADQGLYLIQSLMIEVLANVGAVSPSTFPFNPHVTIAKERSRVMSNPPAWVHLEAPVLWWGDTRGIHSRHQPQAVTA